MSASVCLLFNLYYYSKYSYTAISVRVCVISSLAALSDNYHNDYDKKEKEKVLKC